jgi:hypothetical protein
MDWAPLAAILDEDDMGYWMWMGAQDCEENGELVHFYKHCDTRRYVRLDARGGVYREDGDGRPVPLPPCGGATLLILLAAATGHIEPGVPTHIRVPDSVRGPVSCDDLEALALVLEHVAVDYVTTRERSVDLPPV